MEWKRIDEIDLNDLKEKFIWFFDQKYNSVYSGVYTGSKFWSSSSVSHKRIDVTHYMLIEDKPLPPGMEPVKEVKPSSISNEDNTNLFEIILKDKKQCPHCNLYVSENHNCLEK